MKTNKTILGLTMLFAVSTLAGCGGSNKTRINFWTGFGASVLSTLNPLIARFEEENPDIDIVHDSKGGYPNLLTAVKGTIGNSAYPHIANGYPDHFADYVKAGVLLNLDSPNYINHEEHGVDIDDYYSDYMIENTTLSAGNTYGLPFNKSTEVMITNKTFFEVANKIDSSIKIPTTWQEVAVIGPKLRTVAQDWFGKLVLKDGTAIDKPTEDAEITALLEADTVAFDMSMTTEAQFVPFSWDSTANFFITIIRQWGSLYTSADSIHTGYIEFTTGENRTKTLEALAFFKQLYVDRIVGIPGTFNEALYSSGPFKQVRLVMTISSSAGAAQNLPDSITDFPFEVGVNHIPYNENLPESKYVISQGTNLGLFRVGRATDEKAMAQRTAAWKFLRYLTYEVNHEFGKGTSYFPVTDGSKLAVNEEDPRYRDYKLYTEFLAETDGTSSDKAIRATASLQKNVYQNDTYFGDNVNERWLKFVDPGFGGSAKIRAEIDSIMSILFAGATPEDALNQGTSRLDEYVRK